MARITDLIAFGLSAEDLKRIGRIGGWAPGSYMGKCRTCDGEIAGDKRSTQCFVCAIVALKESATSGTRRQGVAFAIREVEAAIAKVRSSPMRGPHFTRTESD